MPKFEHPPQMRPRRRLRASPYLLCGFRSGRPHLSSLVLSVR
jgi:hypothetical protein